MKYFLYGRFFASNRDFINLHVKAVSKSRLLMTFVQNSSFFQNPYFFGLNYQTQGFFCNPV